MYDPVFDIFREEAREHLGALERGFLDLESAAIDARRALIDNIFRHAHSLKGDAKAVGAVPLQHSAQILEDILDGMRMAPEKIDQACINQALAQLDGVRQGFDTWQRALESSVEGDDVQPSADQQPIIPPNVDLRTATAASPELAPLVTADFAPSSTVSQPAGPVPSVSGPRDENFTVRVPSERLDRMLNLAGELRISQRISGSIQDRITILREILQQLPLGSQRPTSSAERDASQTRTALANWQLQMSDQLRHIENELRKKAMREELLVESLESDIRQARLLPITMLTDSLRRPIRDLARSLGKSIRYDTDVGKIMLDKAVIEALHDPLLHLIRNAADHGLESPAERVAHGKPEEGRIRIEATRRNELVAIAVSDDGRGISYAKIREKIRLTGVDAAAVELLSERELADYLYRPGFSTAEAGEISGRGVGLDVVQTEVHRLHGKLELLNEKDEARSGGPSHPSRHSGSPKSGATFVITVPVTISTVRILTVLAGGQFYGIPTSSIIRTGNAPQESLRELAGHLVVSINDQPVRWVSLSDILGTTSEHVANNSTNRPYLLVSHDGKQTAIAVDDLEDESEVLLKPLGFPLNCLPGIIGGAVRPDGSVQVVLDVAGFAFGRIQTHTARPARPSRMIGRIMIVDDSPTTRSILRNVFTAAGYLVRTACDGVDALERLRSQLVDLVVSDVEMPRMNGLDLTRQIKSKLGLPVILVTGKENEEHRREGLEAGADAYVVKSSFQGDGLLEIVKQFA